VITNQLRYQLSYTGKACGGQKKAAHATLVGGIFDAAAAGQGLLDFFLRAINCGAITAEEATRRTSITLDELRSGSFVKILESRRV
jgi:hypothetical protein